MREQKVEEPSRTSSLPIKGSHLTIRLHSCFHSLVDRYLALLRPDQGFCDPELGVSICLLQGLGGWAQPWMMTVWSPLTQPYLSLLVVGGLSLGFCPSSVRRTWANFSCLQYRFTCGWLVWGLEHSIYWAQLSPLVLVVSSSLSCSLVQFR